MHVAARDRLQQALRIRMQRGVENVGHAAVLDYLIRHLDVAVHLDPLYSAAWKLLGKAATQLGTTGSAIVAYTAGIAAALEKSDKQAAKEMTFFMKRLTGPAAL